MAKITTSNIRTGILVFVTAVPLTTITIIVWWYWGVRGIADPPPSFSPSSFPSFSPYSPSSSFPSSCSDIEHDQGDH